MTIFKMIFMAIGIATIGYCRQESAAAEPSSSAGNMLRTRTYPWYDASRDAYRPMRSEHSRIDQNRSSDKNSTNSTKENRAGRKRRNADSDETSDNREFTLETPSGEPGFRAVLIQILLWIVLGVIVALILVSLFVQWRGRGLSAPADSSPEIPSQVNLERLQALPETARHEQDLLGAAGRLAGESAFGDAMILYFSWQLLELDKQQAIELQKGKTNRRYWREATSARPELTDLFQQSIRLFEDAFFGGLTVSRDDFERVWAQQGLFAAKKAGVRR